LAEIPGVILGRIAVLGPRTPVLGDAQLRLGQVGTFVKNGLKCITEKNLNTQKGKLKNQFSLALSSTLLGQTRRKCAFF
jgi:hypothetical protein